MSFFQRRRLPSIMVLPLVVAGLGLDSAEASAAEAGTTVRASLHSDGSQVAAAAMGPALSSDGRTLLYAVRFDDPAADVDLPAPGGGGWQWVVRDLGTGQIERVSVSADGGPVSDVEPGYAGDISADGDTIVFPASSEQLAPRLPGTTGSSAIFVRDRTAGTTRRLPILQPDGTYSGGPWVQMSDDADLVVFSTTDRLVAGDDDGSWDVFLFDVPAGRLTQLSDHARGRNAEFPAISADGSTVAYMMGMLDDASRAAVWVQDVATGQATRIEWQGVPVQGELPTLSGDGRLVTFNSGDALLPADQEPNRDAYLFDREAGSLTLLSEHDGAQAFGGVNRVEISDDGGTAIIGAGGGLVPGTGPATPEDNGRQYVYRRDLVTGEVGVVNTTPSGGLPGAGDASPGSRSLSVDGSQVAFESASPDLVAGDTNGLSDVFVRTFVRGSLDAALDGSGTPLRTGTDATPEQPVVLSIRPPTALAEGRVTAVPQPVAAGDVPSGYSLFGAVGTVLAISGPDAPSGTVYELTFTVDAGLLAGVGATDVQVFRNGAALPDCAAGPAPCVLSRVAGAAGDVAVTVRTSRFSRWTVGRLRYDLRGPLAPVRAAPAVNPAVAGLPLVVPFRLGGNRGTHVLAAGSPAAAACGGSAAPLPAGAWRLDYVRPLDTYLFTWQTPRRPTGCQDVVLRFRDGSQLTTRFQLR